MKVLYTSDAIRRAIRATFGKGSGRRVAVVAFVGANAEAYLPSPKGLDLYCWPSPTGTNAKALRGLQRLGVNVYFVRRLHMKVYWSANHGAVIASANLSTNAFGRGDLKESGVLLPSRAVDIDRIVRSLRASAATDGDIRRLELESRAIQRGHIAGSERHRSFADWFDERPPGSRWRLMTWSGNVGAAQALRAAAREERTDGKIEDWLNCGRDEVREHDFLLAVDVSSGQPRHPHWMFVHRVVRVARNDRAYERGAPYQAGQVHPTRTCSLPPFRIDRAFRRALSRLPKAAGITPPDVFAVRERPRLRLLKILRDLYVAEAS